MWITDKLEKQAFEIKYNVKQQALKFKLLYNVSKI